MGKINRTLRCSITFPGWRRADLEGKDGLWYSLARVQGEITYAANKLISALWLIQTRAIPWPLNPDGKLRSLETLAYQALSGKWMPYGEDKPVYAPKGRRLCGSALGELARTILQRLKQDWKAALKGEQSIPSFKTLPIMLKADQIEIAPSPETTWALHLWDGRKNNRITVQPFVAEGSQQAILAKIKSGEYKAGSGRLFRDRKGKWTIALSWEGAVADRSGQYIAGVDLNVLTTAAIHYIDAETGAAQNFRDELQIPGDVIRAYNRVENETRARLSGGARVWAARDGQGVSKKVDAAAAFTGKRQRIMDSAAEQIAAAAVAAAKKRQAIAIVVEDLKGLPDKVFDESEDLTAKARAKRRRFFLTGQLYTLRLKIQHAAEREGIRFICVDPAFSNRTCFRCGLVWRKSPYYVKPDEKADTHGRMDQKWFQCTCSPKRVHALRNSAINIALRGRSELLSSK